MNFIEAMRYAHSARHRSVKRPEHDWFVWYDPDLFLNCVPFGFRAERVGDDSWSYSPSMEDVDATDWEIVS